MNRMFRIKPELILSILDILISCNIPFGKKLIFH